VAVVLAVERGSSNRPISRMVINFVKVAVVIVVVVASALKVFKGSVLFQE